MERYGWMIVLVVIASVDLIAFFIFLHRDAEHIRLQKKSKLLLGFNVSLIAISAISLALSIYLYFDIQEQLRIMGSL